MNRAVGPQPKPQPQWERYAQPSAAIQVDRSACRPTGQDLFDAMTHDEQDAMFGADVAEAIRTGKVKLSDLVKPAPMKTEPDFITAKTPADLGLG
jgi:hypothetical protein